MAYLNILLPVYNEHNRLERGVRRTVAHMDKLLPGDYCLTVVDNASADDTPAIGRRLAEEYSQVSYIRFESKGVGVAFREGLLANSCPYCGYMDIDLSTDLRHLDEVIAAFKADPVLQMVNASRWGAGSAAIGRKWYRNVASHGLVAFLKLGLGMRASDAVCGFKFFKADFALSLIGEAGESDDGWSYIIEILLRAERCGANILELPVRWVDDHDTKVRVLSQTLDFLVNIIRLRKVLGES